MTIASLILYSTSHQLQITVEPWLSGFLDYPDFFSGPNFVMIKIPSHILFKTTALKSKVNASLFLFQKAK